MLKKFIVAGALALGLLGVGVAGPASAGADIDIGIGVGRGGGGRISCRQGAHIVANAGFRRVRPLDCSGSQYAYRGFRHDNMFEISVRSRSGRITNVERIRRGGGYGGGGGYGDDSDDDGDY